MTQKIMDKHLFEFFKTISEPHRPYERDNLQTSLIERTADAFARNTHLCMYISNAQTQKFFYASGKFERLSGLTAEKVKEMGFRFYLDFVPEEEHRILYTAFKEGQHFLCNQPSSERTEYNISCDIHVLNGRKKLLVHQTATPILIGRDGMPLFSLCIMKHSVMHEIGNITVKRKGHRAFYKYDMDKGEWIKDSGIILNETERGILTLSAQGHKMEDIANKLCKSLDTIKSAKRRLFLKMNVSNLQEAVASAEYYDLL